MVTVTVTHEHTCVLGLLCLVLSHDRTLGSESHSAHDSCHQQSQATCTSLWTCNHDLVSRLVAKSPREPKVWTLMASEGHRPYQWLAES